MHGTKTGLFTPAVQVVCIVVILVGTFDIILHNVGELREGSLDTLSKSE